MVDLEEGEKSLRRILVEEGAMPWREVVRLGVDVATQLDAFHKRGVCPHGGVCPESIVQTANRLGYVLSPPTVGVPPSYRAPEAFRRGGSENIDARADVFSLGIVLFEALAGNRVYPFRVVDPEPGGFNEQPSYLPENDLSSVAPGVPVGLRRVVERATRLVPENRFESALALAEALRGVADEPSVEAPKALRGASARRPHVWRRAMAGGGVAVVMALALALVVVLATRRTAVNPSGDDTRLRSEASELSAQTLVPELWQAAETARQQQDQVKAAELYRQARDAAWQKRLQQVEAAAEQASAFNATGEAAFARANDARTRAEHLWAGRHVAEALKSLAEAEEFYLAAVVSRRERWAEGIRAQLHRESERGGGQLRPEDEGKVRMLEAEVLRLIGGAEPSVNDLRSAEAKITELRHEITAALERAGHLAAARRTGAEAVQRAETAQRAAARAAQAFPRLETAYSRGKEFLDAARSALEKDPSQAVTLAEEATQRFRHVEGQAEKELVQLRQLASNARRRAREAEAEREAEETYARAEASWRKAEAKDLDWLQRRDAYQEARAGFDEAVDRAREARTMAAREPLPQLPPPAPPHTEPARLPEPTIATQPHTSAALALPTTHLPTPRLAPPSRDRIEPAQQGPMPPDLAAGIQNWLRETCENLNRTLARSGGSRARCEELVVLDRRDRSQVRIAYSLVQGTLVPEGIRWGVPNQRSATLDCSHTACRCISGDGC